MTRGRHPHSTTDDPVWASFCAGVEPLSRSTSATKPSAKPSADAARQDTVHHPILAPVYLPSDEAEDFAQLMGEWEAGHGSFRPTMAAPSAPKPIPEVIAAIQAPRAPAPPQPPKLNQWHNVDAATARKLARGQMPIDAVLDLHGLNLEQGFDSVAGMVQLGRMRGWRLLLIITGKGRTRMEPGLVAGDGKLRRALPKWLADGSIAPHVIAAGSAHVRHGGQGAYYLLLRRAERGTAPGNWGAQS